MMPNVGTLMEALDWEFLNFSGELGVDVLTICTHYFWSFGVPMDTSIIKDESEEDREENIGDGSTDDDDELSLLSLMVKRTALKTRMVAWRMRPLRCQRWTSTCITTSMAPTCMVLHYRYCS